jgi:hypothetical protein
VPKVPPAQVVNKLLPNTVARGSLAVDVDDGQLLVAIRTVTESGLQHFGRFGGSKVGESVSEYSFICAN